MRPYQYRICLLFITTLISGPLYAHGGGLDSYGCHNNRKAGGYHCHRGENAGKSYSSQSEMLRSVQSQGKAVPAEPTTQNRQLNNSSSLDTIQGKVVAITDGDTATILMNNVQYKIRLAEIDTPERGQPYGARAKEALSGLIFGKEVTAKVQDQDRYDRYVARIYQGELDVSREMVKQGAAWVYRQYLTDRSLLQDEREARDSRRGLWGLPEAEKTPPWEWRRSQFFAI